MQTMRDQIVGRIKRLGEGKAFSAKDFLDIASRGTIDMALGSLTRNGTIRRIRRGLYDMPKVNPTLGGKLSPDIDEAAQAIARESRLKIVTIIVVGSEHDRRARASPLTEDPTR